jgi:hypothetical protein
MMQKKYLFIPLLFLFGLLYADLDCFPSSPINQGGNLDVHCITKPSQSECTANVSDDSGHFIAQYPEYPEGTLQEFKQPITTSRDGQFSISIFMNDKKYFNGYNYTATITCLDPSDNSTNQTSIDFTPTTYSSIGGTIIGITLWLRNEALIIILVVISTLFLLLFFLLLLRQIGFFER